jgi:hypothetical protein
MRRWLFRLGVVAVVIVVGLVVAAKLVQRTDFAINKVVAHIQEKAGGAAVRVGSLDVGVTSSALHDLQFLEAGAAEGSPPWVTVTTVETDLPLPQLIRGELAGATITLRGPKLILRFDRDNHLLTKFPPSEGVSQEWPEFRIVSGQVTCQRDGTPDALFNGVAGTLRRDGDRITFEGTADDPEWGRWTIAGDRSTADAPFKLTLHTDQVHLTPEKLRRVPFVSPVTWNHVLLDGETPVDVALQFGGPPSGPAVRYRVALAPRKSILQVPSIDLTTLDTAGKALIEDGVVTLTDVRGHVADGALHLVRGLIDFRGEGPDIRFSITAERLQTRDLPKKWGLGRWTGPLSGRADVAVAIRPGQMRTAGGGEGVIGSFVAQQSKVKLVPDENGFHFDVTESPGGR